MHSPVQALQHTRVLVVEDTPDSQDLLLFILQAEGAEVVCTITAQAALETLESFRADVILCDLMLPDTDGYSLIRSWRAREIELGRPPVPALALSAFSGEQCRQQSLEAGFQALIAKPLDVVDLPQVVATAVGRGAKPQFPAAMAE